MSPHEIAYRLDGRDVPWSEVPTRNLQDTIRRCPHTTAAEYAQKELDRRAGKTKMVRGAPAIVLAEEGAPLFVLSPSRGWMPVREKDREATIARAKLIGFPGVVVYGVEAK